MPAVSQHDFVSALTGRDLPVPDGLTCWTGPRPKRRFDVYRNNVSAALIDALTVRYPVVSRLVGERFFRAMTREYVIGELPRSPVLIDYGETYPDFAGGFPATASLPYLGDVARLESNYWRAYHAADVETLEPEGFAALDTGTLPSIRFAFHPSTGVVPSRWPIVSIWETNTNDMEVKPVDLDRAESALVARPYLDVEVRRLSCGGVALLSELMCGRALGEAACLAIESEPDLDLAINLARLIEARIVTRIVTA